MALRINEVFTSIQGESTLAGKPCVFVRLTACNLRCTYCDTAYAFTEGTDRSLEETLVEVRSRGFRDVCVTGGEPLLQPEVYLFMSRLLAEGFNVSLETSNSMSIADVPGGVKKILDIKTPGSGESSANLWENLSRLSPGDELKFVLCDRADYEWSRRVLNEHAEVLRHEVLFSPVHGLLDPKDLAAWILADRLSVRLHLQIHKYIWGSGARGV